jgi:hypothetical protein
VAPIRCQDIDLDDVLASFSGQRVGLPLPYLGIPLTIGRLRLVHLQPIKDKALAKMSGWQCRLLNPGGRRVLVRSVLSSLPVYLLTVMKLTSEIFHQRFLTKSGAAFSGRGTSSYMEASVRSAGHVCNDRSTREVWASQCFSRALRLRWL